MKLHASVTHISELIEIPSKKEGWWPMLKKIVCVKEIDEDKENLESPAIDFMGEALKELELINVWDIVDVNFRIVHNRYPDKTTNEDKIYNSVRWWRIVKRGELPKEEKKDPSDNLPF